MAVDEPGWRALPMEGLFRQDAPGRGAYLSRMFAFFSEEIVRHWTRCDQSPFRDLGRPVIWDSDGSSRFHVLDFTLERLADGARLVAELKCEVEFERYRYLVLTDVEQLDHHARNPAFRKFLRAASEPGSQRVTIGGREIETHGAVLVWGVVTERGRAAVQQKYGFAEVLSVEQMLTDLRNWRNPEWANWVGVRRSWAGELFDWLTAGPPV